MRNVDNASEYRGLELSCVENPVDGFHLVQDADAWRHELEFNVQQRYHAWGPRFVGWHSFGIFVSLPIERNDFYTPVSNGRDRKWNCAYGVPPPVVFSCLAGHLRLSGSRVCKHLQRMAGVGIAMTTHGVFLRTLRTDLSIAWRRMIQLTFEVMIIPSSVSLKEWSAYGLV